MASQTARDLPDLKVGDRVFAIITPATFSSFTRSYRPKPYYVLETRVSGVRDRGAGEKEYLFDMPFYVMRGRITASPDEAKKRLVEIFALETDGVLPIGKVRLVSSDEQKAGERIVQASPVAVPPAYAAP
jgi:hypothetical protein